MQEFYAGLDRFHPIFRATATQVGEGFVEYRDETESLRRVACDSVVALGGMRPLQTEAMAFDACARDFYMIGDCRQVGDLHTGSRAAYAVTHQF